MSTSNRTTWRALAVGWLLRLNVHLFCSKSVKITHIHSARSTSKCFLGLLLSIGFSPFVALFSPLAEEAEETGEETCQHALKRSLHPQWRIWCSLLYLSVEEHWVYLCPISASLQHSAVSSKICVHAGVCDRATHYSHLHIPLLHAFDAFLYYTLSHRCHAWSMSRTERYLTSIKLKAYGERSEKSGGQD